VPLRGWSQREKAQRTEYN